ncbi:MAG: hypothetical protein R6V21_09090 [Pelovirga sp.]
MPSNTQGIDLKSHDEQAPLHSKSRGLSLGALRRNAADDDRLIVLLMLVDIDFLMKDQ